MVNSRPKSKFYNSAQHFVQAYITFYGLQIQASNDEHYATNDARGKGKSSQ